MSLHRTVRACATERNWRSYGLIHSGSCDRLWTKRAADLVYVHTNLCMHSANCPPSGRRPTPS
eukprot:70899-Chlamydomonas_euryale.AAC.1